MFQSAPSQRFTICLPSCVTTFFFSLPLHCPPLTVIYRPLTVIPILSHSLFLLQKVRLTVSSARVIYSRTSLFTLELCSFLSSVGLFFSLSLFSLSVKMTHSLTFLILILPTVSSRLSPTSGPCTLLLLVLFPVDLLQASEGKKKKKNRC